MIYGWDLKIDGTGMKDALGRGDDWPNPEYPRFTPEQKAAWDDAYNPKNEKFLAAKLTGKDLVRWKYQRYIKDYLRCIAAVDENIGKMLDYLEESGEMDNTIVIYSSDQGFFLGEHGWYDKRWMYEESLRMPFIMAWPGHIKPGTKINQLIQNIDYAPTFLDAAGVDIPCEVQGYSMLPLFESKDADWRDAIYYSYLEIGEHNVPRHDGVRTDRFKLMHFYDNDDWDLYDLMEDPQEMRDVIDDPIYAEVRDEMIKRYHAERKRYKAMPIGWGPEKMYVPINPLNNK
jgi:arylsulfatase A-like enzyme